MYRKQYYISCSYFVVMRIKVLVYSLLSAHGIVIYFATHCLVRVEKNTEQHQKFDVIYNLCILRSNLTMI